MKTSEKNAMQRGERRSPSGHAVQSRTDKCCQVTSDVGPSLSWFSSLHPPVAVIIHCTCLSYLVYLLVNGFQTIHFPWLTNEMWQHCIALNCSRQKPFVSLPSNNLGPQMTAARDCCIFLVEVRRKRNGLCITDSMVLSSPWEADSCPATQEFPNILRNPECSKPCSQEPATGPYPEPDEFSPHLPPPIFI
jgi:hypothetical protein